MNEEPRWDFDEEIDSALRSAPLVKPPASLYAGIMKQVRSTTTLPEFHITWLDFGVSLLGSLSVAIFLSSLVFMPTPLRLQAEFLVQWAGYLGKSSILGIIPALVAVIVLVGAGFTLTRTSKYLQ